MLNRVRFKPRFALSSLLWLTLAIACFFLGRNSIRWTGNELSLRNTAFCKSVTSYGQFEPVTQPQFAPGEFVTVYTEVLNLSTKESKEGFETALGGEYRIFDSKGNEVLRKNLPANRQKSVSLRHDQFTAYRLRMPQLADGQYHLQLVIRDQHAAKVGSSASSFELVSPDVSNSL